MRNAYNIPQCGSTQHVNTSVVRPLNVVDRSAVECIVRAIVEMIRVVHQPNLAYPVPDLLSPLSVRLVARISSKTCGNVEEAAVGNGVLVVVAAVEGEDLPPQTAAASGRVPSRYIVVEHGLRERQPLGLVCGGVREVEFCGRHGSHCPEALIVISFRLGLVRWHIVLVGADLPQHSLRRDGIVLIVAGEEPVVY